MRPKWHLNGTDYLMLGFDHELRRRGYAGNSCQIVLELGAAISVETLQQRATTVAARYPILNARPSGWFCPRWKLPKGIVSAPRIRVHQDQPALPQRILNEPLAVQRGELARFDLIQRNEDRATLVFTWAHALLDGPGAEHLLALIGREDSLLPDALPALKHRAPRPLKERFKLGWKSLRQIEQFANVAPRSLAPRHLGVPANVCYRVEKFSAEDTARIRTNGSRICGVLGGAQFHAAAAMVELHRLHQRLGSPTPSYVLPLPVGLRSKGRLEPLFGNQVTMLMLQLLPEHLDSLQQTAAALKAQTERAMRAGLLESGIVLSELFRFLPLPIYMAIMKQGLRGEICSLFFGDIAGVNPLLSRFLGAAVEDVTHVAAVTPSPGLGVVFYYFRGELRITILHLAAVLSDAEAAEFAAKLRASLLHV